MTCVLLCKSTRTLLKSVCVCAFFLPKVMCASECNVGHYFYAFCAQVKCVWRISLMETPVVCVCVCLLYFTCCVFCARKNSKCHICAADEWGNANCFVFKKEIESGINHTKLWLKSQASRTYNITMQARNKSELQQCVYSAKSLLVHSNSN